MITKIEFYKRLIDDGHGWQEVTVVNNIIEHQEIFAKQGYYTGGGDPEFVGQHKKILRGRGFKKVKKNKAKIKKIRRFRPLTECRLRNENNKK